MDAKSWKKKIKSAMEAGGTYQKHFDMAVDTLSSILEKRDEAQRQYDASGGKPVVFHTNKSHERNLVKNPCLVAWCDLNTQALAYFRDLGLTPSGLKKIDESAVKQKKRSAIADVLSKLEEDSR